MVLAQHNTRHKANVRQTDRNRKVECQSYTQNGTSAAQHKTQSKRKADRWKDGRSEMMEGENKISSLFAFSQIPSLLLIVNNSNSTLSIFVDQ